MTFLWAQLLHNEIAPFSGDYLEDEVALPAVTDHKANPIFVFMGFISPAYGFYWPLARTAWSFSFGADIRIQCRCDPIDILLEMDRILRPEGAVIFRDQQDVLRKVRKIVRGMRWNTKMVDHEDGPLAIEKVLFAVKKYWVAGENNSTSSRWTEKEIGTTLARHQQELALSLNWRPSWSEAEGRGFLLHLLLTISCVSVVNRDYL